MGWSNEKLGDYCEVIAGQSPEGKYYNTEGQGLPFYQGKKEFGERYIGEPQKWTSKTTKEAKVGDILMSVRAPVGPINFSTQDICIGRGLAAIRPSDLLDKEFLFYYLFLKQDEIQGSEGAVFASINKSQIEALSFSYVNLEEQKRIVAILDQAFADIDKARALTEQNLKNARELFESYLQQVFSQRGEGWVEGKLGTFCEKITVGHVGSMASRYKDEGVIFLRSQNVRPFHISLNGVKYIDEEFNRELKKSQLEPGDVAIVRTGYPGTAAVIPHSLPVSNCSDLVIAKTKPSLSPHFLTLFLNSSYGKELIANNLVGAAQKHFNVTAAKNVTFSAPGLKEQEFMVAAAESFRQEVKKIEDIYLVKLQTLDQLKKSILHKAFTGQLTAQDAA